MADLTAEQTRNRARALIALRIVSGLLAVGVGANLWASFRDGYVRLEYGEHRGPGSAFIQLDTPLGIALGRLMLEIVIVFFVIVAISPRSALRPRLWLASLVTVLVIWGLVQSIFG